MMVHRLSSSFDLKVFIACLVGMASVKSQLSPDPYCINSRPSISVLPEQCCSIPDFFDNGLLARCKSTDGTDSLVRPEIGRKKRFATSRMGLGTCYLDCVFQGAGVTTSNGQVLDTNKLLRVLASETPTEQETINVISSAVTQCISDLNAGLLRIRSSTVSNCSTIPSAIMMCIHRKFFQSCPARRFVNVQQCIQLRDYLNRCPVVL